MEHSAEMGKIKVNILMTFKITQTEQKLVMELLSLTLKIIAVTHFTFLWTECLQEYLPGDIKNQ